MDPALFQRMADTTNHGPDDVWRGIEAAMSVGLGVKINTVVQKGVNDNELLPLAKACVDRNIPLRFIEFMDVGNTNAWRLEDVVTGREVRSASGTVWSSRTAAGNGSQPSCTHLRDDGRVPFRFHRIGFKSFCGDCSRARLSANGSLYTCLFSSAGH